MMDQVSNIVEYIQDIHSKYADGCKGSCFEQEVGFHRSVHNGSYWFVRFGGYCFGDLSREEEVRCDELSGLLSKVQKHIEDALYRHEESFKD